MNSTYFLCMSFCLFSFYLLKLPCFFLFFLLFVVPLFWFIFVQVCCNVEVGILLTFFSSSMPNYFIANTTCFSFFICVALHILFKLLSIFSVYYTMDFQHFQGCFLTLNFFCIFLFLFIIFVGLFDSTSQCPLSDGFKKVL